MYLGGADAPPNLPAMHTIQADSVLLVLFMGCLADRLPQEKQRNTMVKHFLYTTDLSREETEALLKRAQALKTEWHSGRHPALLLQGKTLALVFEKPSLRTRVAFEAGMTQLGGHGSYLSANDID